MSMWYKVPFLPAECSTIRVARGQLNLNFPSPLMAFNMEKKNEKEGKENKC
jgi:hypothetical protein